MARDAFAPSEGGINLPVKPEDADGPDGRQTGSYYCNPAAGYWKAEYSDKQYNDMYCIQFVRPKRLEERRRKHELGAIDMGSLPFSEWPEMPDLEMKLCAVPVEGFVIMPHFCRPETQVVT